ncbi:MAG TPA: DUF2110 family protein [Methanosarcinaceae archaeon]|nr:DUF2110 family protein [Methanosarcinaceae archaeon]
MESIILHLNIYDSHDRAVRSIESVIANDIKDIDASTEIHATSDGRVQVDITGEDDEFCANYLLGKYGSPIKKAEVGETYKGYIHSIGEDGIVVDIGIKVNITPDGLKPLGTGEVKQIALRFGIIPHLPVSIEIVKVDGDTKVCFTKKQVDLWWKWKKSGTDRVIANAVTRSELKAAIKKTGHARDIYGIERMGIMEHAIVCREKTDGPGIVADIGPLLRSDLGVIVKRA